MAVSVPAGGYVGASDAGASASLSLAIPGIAVVGDYLVVAAICERTTLPSLLINNAANSFVVVRSEAGQNISTIFAYKQLNSVDLNGTVTVSNTTVHRHALAMMIVRGASAPQYVNQAYSAATANGPAAKTGATATSSVANPLLVGMWAADRTSTPWTGWTLSSNWTERVEAVGTYASGINPAAYLTTTLPSVAAGGTTPAETVTISTAPWDSMNTVMGFGASTTPPTVSVVATVGMATIDASDSVSPDGSALAFGITPTTGVKNIQTGVWLVPIPAAGASPVTYTVTVGSSGGSSATGAATIQPASAPQGYAMKLRTNGAYS